MMRVSTIMNASTLTMRNLNGYDHLIVNGPCIQCVRWKRKPIWLPTAKSKMFRIPQRPVIPKEESTELKRLFNNYRTAMNSFRHYFFEIEKANRVEFDEETVKQKTKEDFLKCSKINDDWNKQVAVEREFRYNKQREERVNEIKLKLEAKKAREVETQARVDSEIRKAKEEAVTFITSNNIDEAIEKVLQTIVNHNAAIDLKGNFYTDDYTKTQLPNSIESKV